MELYQCIVACISIICISAVFTWFFTKIWKYTIQGSNYLSDKPFVNVTNDTWINEKALEAVLSPNEFKELKLKLRKLSVSS